jgi:predicted neuraminidase
LWLKPNDFGDAGRAMLDQHIAKLSDPLSERLQQAVVRVRDRLGDKLYQRLGWQPRCKPTILPSGRMVLPLYSDTYSFSLMAVSDDGGMTWRAGEPMMGFGNIQPSVLRRDNGTLVAYMRENGSLEKVRVSESQDDGMTWGPVGTIEMPNPGSGLDAVRLRNGHWLLIHNDTVTGRNRLAASLSTDEGRTWKVTRHLEDHASGSYHYPAVIQGKDDRIHVAYSYFNDSGKSMKHAEFDEDWLLQARPR